MLIRDPEGQIFLFAPNIHEAPYSFSCIPSNIDEYYTWDIGSVWNKHWPETMYVGQWPAFHGPVIFPCIFKTI